MRVGRFAQAHDDGPDRGLGQQVLPAHVHPPDAAILVPAVQPGEERDAGAREQVTDERLPALDIVRTGETVRGVTVQFAGGVAEHLGDSGTRPLDAAVPIQHEETVAAQGGERRQARDVGHHGWPANSTRRARRERASRRSVHSREE